MSVQRRSVVFDPATLSASSRALFDRMCDRLDPEDVETLKILRTRLFNYLACEIIADDGHFTAEVELALRAVCDVLDRPGLTVDMRRAGVALQLTAAGF
jgi:hypothetical protein